MGFPLQVWEILEVIVDGGLVRLWESWRKPCTCGPKLGIINLRTLLVIGFQRRDLGAGIDYMYGFVFRLLLRFVVDVEEEARRIGVPFIVSVLALVLVIVEVLEGITIFDLFSEDLLFFDGGAVKVHV